MKKAQRGINLGGWLVAERWMTPELFRDIKGEGEIALVKELGRKEALGRLTKHRDEFITEKDFSWIKSHGFDFVRLPVGYWLFEQTSDFIDGEDYLRLAFKWADKHNLAVVLDFHGLQGSQNGFDHSGQVGRVRLYRRGNFYNALSTLEYMCRTYGNEPALIGLEVINEPKVKFCMWRLLRYYDRAVSVAAPHLPLGVKIVVSDAFKPLRMAKKLSKKAYKDRVVLDVHLYQVFSAADKLLSLNQHIFKAESQWSNILQRCARHVPVMVGEWSAALPPAAYRGERGGEAENVRAYYKAQSQTFTRHAWAEAYWSYKAPGCGVWDFSTQPDFWHKQRQSR